MNTLYAVKVNQHHDIQIDRDFLAQADIQRNHDGTLHIIHDGKSYRAELLEVKDADSKKMSLKINDAIFEISLKDELDLLIDKMGMKANVKKISSDIIAPMPGLVLKILVENGQTIEAGQPILILEAMKMENVLKSEGNGHVKDILSKTGDSVEKGQILVQIQPTV